MLREPLKHLYQIWWLKCVTFTREKEAQRQAGGLTATFSGWVVVWLTAWTERHNP